MTLLTLTCICTPAAAQNILETHITLSKNKYRLYDLIREIKQQQDISLSYVSGQIDSRKQIVISNRLTTLASIIYTLKKEHNIQSKIIGRHIILSSRKPTHKKTKRKAKEKISGARQQTNRSPHTTTAPIRPADNIIPDANIDSATYMAAVVIADSGFAGGGGGGGNGFVQEEQNRTRRIKRLQAFRDEVFIAPAFYADDLFFANVQLGMGYKHLYGTLAYAFKGELGHFRYGINANIPLGKQWAMNIFINNGTPITKDINYTYSRDTLFSGDPDSPLVTITSQGTLRTRTTLFKAGISFEYTFYKRIHFSIGPVFNRSHTYFYQNGQPVSLAAIAPGQAIGKHDFSVLKPWSTLHDDFNVNNTGRIKTWIGIQATATFLLFGKSD